jgi:hypothetical protein
MITVDLNCSSIIKATAEDKTAAPTPIAMNVFRRSKMNRRRCVELSWESEVLMK